MCVNRKMIAVEIIPGMGVRKSKGERWRAEFKYDIFVLL
jgi:hypothetical protein